MSRSCCNKSDVYKASRLLKQLKDNAEIIVLRNEKGITYYGKKQ
jgi:hypothetical protein